MNETINKYRISGTDRAVGAIGTMDNFSVVVKSTSPKAAMERQRELRCGILQRDHVLFTKVEQEVDGQWAEVPMMEALELE